jgi:F-type H+-transporting ATPase subunit delta
VNNTKSARRYARAIIETATDTEAVRDELGSVSGTLKTNPALLAALSNPGVPTANKKAIFSTVFQGLSMPLPRLFDMLIDASRIELVHEIVHRYRDEWNARNNVHVAQVTTAFALDDEADQRVRKALEALVAGTVQMETSVDPALMGGLKVEVNGHLFDGTVRARLKALRQHLL